MLQVSKYSRSKVQRTDAKKANYSEDKDSMEEQPTDTKILTINERLDKTKQKSRVSCMQVSLNKLHNIDISKCKSQR